MANKVGPLIKDARTKAKLSQTALAEQLDGVTQSSLLNAAKESTYTAAAAAKKPSDSSPAKKTTASSASKKTAASSKASMDLTAAEKKLVELYRAADTETRKKAVAVLKGEAVDNGDLFSTLLGMAGDILGKK